MEFPQASTTVARLKSPNLDTLQAVRGLQKTGDKTNRLLGALADRVMTRDAKLRDIGCNIPVCCPR